WLCRSDIFVAIQTCRHIGTQKIIGPPLPGIATKMSLLHNKYSIATKMSLLPGCYSCQLIGGCPCAIKYSLIRKNWWLPKNPRWADNGDGCTELKTRCLWASIMAPFFCA